MIKKRNSKKKKTVPKFASRS